LVIWTDLTFTVGVGSPDNERFGRAVDELVRVLPDGSRLLSPAASWSCVADQQAQPVFGGAARFVP
jgi:hypothetical protein